VQHVGLELDAIVLESEQHVAGAETPDQASRRDIISADLAKASKCLSLPHMILALPVGEVRPEEILTTLSATI
jgi:hypothetical protein